MYMMSVVVHCGRGGRRRGGEVGGGEGGGEDRKAHLGVWLFEEPKLKGGGVRPSVSQATSHLVCTYVHVFYKYTLQNFCTCRRANPLPLEALLGGGGITLGAGRIYSSAFGNDLAFTYGRAFGNASKRGPSGPKKNSTLFAMSDIRKSS